MSRRRQRPDGQSDRATESQSLAATAGRSDRVAEDLGFRAIEVRASTLDVDERSIEALVSTENPVPMIDWERYELIPEVLLTSGAELPKSRQVPLLDSHQRWSVDNQLGSARGLEKTERGVVARLHFSSAAESQFTKVREGHVSDVSIGYQVLKKTFVPAGERRKIAGKEYEGPLNVVTKWRAREVSLTPIGADEMAKLRGLEVAALPPQIFGRGPGSPTQGRFTMNPELRKLLESRGMSETLSDDDAQKWFLDNQARLLAPEAPAAAANPAPAPAPAAAGIGRRETPAALTADEMRAEFRKAIEEERAAARRFDGEVRSLCELADLPEAFEACRVMPDIEEVRKHLAAEKKKRADLDAVNPAPRVRITGEGYARFVGDVGTAIALRACESVAEKKETIEKVFPAAQRAAGHERFRHMTIYQCAEECLRMAGVDVRGRTREDVAIAAMFGPEAIGIRSSGAALHVTGNFLKITQDALNKSMQIGYTEAPSTWEGPMARGQSASDFKTIHRMRLGAVPNLPVWNDNVDPQKASFADAEETYAVEARSLEISFSYRLLVNDDMSALTRTPAQMGQAARRTVNAVAWAQVTSNPTMSDGIALFSAASGARKRKNLETGANAPSVTTLGLMKNNMRQMRGENTPEGNESDDVLNVIGRYLVGPSALETVIQQLVLSVYDPAASSIQVYNPASSLLPVIEPLLDAASTTAYYLFASPQQIDTVEVTFLQGQESPIARQYMDPRTLSQCWIILQTFAAKAMNHRGIQKHAGA